MTDETHKLQDQPAEGSRKVVERELKRQGDKPDAQEKQRDQEKPDQARE